MTGILCVEPKNLTGKFDWNSARSAEKNLTGICKTLKKHCLAENLQNVLFSRRNNAAFVRMWYSFLRLSGLQQCISMIEIR